VSRAVPEPSPGPTPAPEGASPAIGESSVAARPADVSGGPSSGVASVPADDGLSGGGGTTPSGAAGAAPPPALAGQAVAASRSALAPVHSAGAAGNAVAVFGLLAVAAAVIASRKGAGRWNS
jgi:hypothetical protein